MRKSIIMALVIGISIVGVLETKSLKAGELTPVDQISADNSPLLAQSVVKRSKTKTTTTKMKKTDPRDEEIASLKQRVTFLEKQISGNRGKVQNLEQENARLKQMIRDSRSILNRLK